MVFSFCFLFYSVIVYVIQLDNDLSRDISGAESSVQGCQEKFILY